MPQHIAHIPGNCGGSPELVDIVGIVLEELEIPVFMNNPIGGDAGCQHGGPEFMEFLHPQLRQGQGNIFIGNFPGGYFLVRKATQDGNDQEGNEGHGDQCLYQCKTGCIFFIFQF
jgi:hypothetical protein